MPHHKKPHYIVITASPDSIDDIEAYGPFTSHRLAQKFADEFEEFGVRPAYPVEVVELASVREGQSQIRDAKADGEFL
jgi:hypothetical protein